MDLDELWVMTSLALPSFQTPITGEYQLIFQIRLLQAVDGFKVQGLRVA